MRTDEEGWLVNGDALALVCRHPNLYNQSDIWVIHASRRHVTGEHDGGCGGTKLVADARAVRLALARVDFENGDAHGVE